MKIITEGFKAAVFMLLIIVPIAILLFFLPTYRLNQEVNKLEGQMWTVESGESFVIEKVEPNCVIVFCTTKVEARACVTLPSGPDYDFVSVDEKDLIITADGVKQVWSREEIVARFYDELESRTHKPFPIVTNEWKVEGFSTSFFYN